MEEYVSQKISKDKDFEKYDTDFILWERIRTGCVKDPENYDYLEDFNAYVANYQDDMAWDLDERKWVNKIELYKKKEAER